MWLEAFNRLQKRRFHHFVWLAAVLVVIAVLISEWQQVNEKAEQARLKVLVQTFHKSASSFRQLWELNGKPVQLEKEGIQLTFTKLGWPIVLTEEQVDCEKTWNLLSSRTNSVAYAGFYTKREVGSTRYNFCYYQLTDGKWLELFYENETIRINGFLTEKASPF